MKTLAGYTILYDAECPMCNLYTQAFVSSGMIAQDGRTPYQQIPENTACQVNMQRAVNEIALVNNTTGEVSYGITSLFVIIGHSFPVFKRLFNNRFFIFIMSKAYAFVSYNRRVIVPARHIAGTVQPTFKLGYRLAYLVYTWLAVSIILTHYASLLGGFVPVGGQYREYLICGGQIIFQGIIASTLAPIKKWDYLGNMMTISFAGALLLLPMLVIAHLVVLPAIVATSYFLAVAVLMFLEHVRRTGLLRLGWLLSTTWVVYRIVVLIVVL